MPNPVSANPALIVLRQRPLALFVSSRFLSGIALTLLRATISWQVYRISGSAFHLGLVGVVQFLPALLFSLLGGVAADNYDRKRLVIFSQVVPALGSGFLVIANLEGFVTLPWLYGVVFVIAISTAFENPARGAFLPQLVDVAQFPAAVTVHTAIQMFAFMSGPVLMGFVLASFGIAAPYALHFVCVLGSIALMTAVNPQAPQTLRSGMRWSAIREGLSYVRRQPVVLGCMTLDMFAVLFAGATALLPIYATDILHVGARGYGVLSSALEIGATGMALVMMAMPAVRRAGRALMLAVVAFGLSTVVFGLSRSFPISLAAYMVAGMADYMSMVMRGTAIQLATPDRLRGRVSAVNSIFIGASNQLGAAESGFVAALTSPTFAVVSGGVGALVVVALVAWLNPVLRAYRVEPG